MNNYFKVGCNFTQELADAVIEMNKKNPNNKVTDMYGSRRASHMLTARPEFRLPDISKMDFTNYIKRLDDNGISFSYTLNTSYLGGKEEMESARERIKDYIRFLIDSGVKSFIITLPYMAELVREVSPEIGLEVSTIANIDTVSKAKIWYDRYGINKICVGVEKNRNISFLQSLSKYCEKNSITPTLLVNEFCGNGDVNSTCTAGCIYRGHCYQLHSIGYPERKTTESYPMSRCIESRSTAETWLKLNFIRPEDLRLYKGIGINHFKITGRTGTSEHLIKVLQGYMGERYEGNLLELWKHLETIHSKEDSTFAPSVCIENSELTGFVDFWFTSRRNGCDNEECGATCNYCESFLQKHMVISTGERRPHVVND